MRQLDLKKLLLPNLPYLLIGLYATKLGEAWRLAPGADASAKLLGLMDGFAAAFQSALPSFHPVDLLVGLCCGAALRLAVYFKGKNAKKYLLRGCPAPGCLHQGQERQEVPQEHGIRFGPLGDGGGHQAVYGPGV